jgi:hypothetical protein
VLPIPQVLPLMHWVDVPARPPPLAQHTLPLGHVSAVHPTEMPMHIP